jgi:hypothetical protein
VIPPTSPHWLARSHEHRAWVGIYIYIYIYDTVGSFNHFRTLRTRTEMDLETLVSSCFNHLTRLVAREDFIISRLHCIYENNDKNSLLLQNIWVHKCVHKSLK